jgi:Phosphotransferase enzyme family
VQLHLEERLASHFGRRCPIVKLERRPCPYSSSFPVDELDVHLADGSDLRLVMKDLSFAAMSARARRMRPEFLYEPRREIQVYRWILPYAPAGTPTWYGAVTSSTSRRHWLFLERVDGLELRHVGALSTWKRAAQWIARFHQSFPSKGVARLVHTSRLLVYDEAFYWLWLDRARAFVARRPDERQIVDRIARCYATVVKRLVAMPLTLIHGEFYPCNIVIREAGGEVRVCPVDWEMAAFAPGPMDLASLTTGWARAAQQALTRAYWAATPEGTRSPRVPADFSIDLDCCRLHLAVKMLGWSDAWEPPPQHAFDWLSDAARIAERLPT